jgi:peptide/nickel transport system substrate-binding protein
VPRAEIVDKIVKPIIADAEPRDSFEYFPGQDGYDEVSEANGLKAYDEVDIDGAKQLLAEVGVTTPVDVRWMFGPSPTGTRIYQLTHESAAQAGFNVIDSSSEDWDVRLGSGDHDVAAFAWVTTSVAVSEGSANYITGGQNNFGHFSSATVDTAYKDLYGELDPEDQKQLLIDVEKELVAHGFGLPLYQSAGLTAYASDRLTGVEPSPISPQFLSEFWNWDTPAK